MSGRIYDHWDGIPTCKKCRRTALRSEETNFNGCYCKKCKGSKMFDKYDTDHPLWKGYMKMLHENQKNLNLEGFRLDAFVTYKKKMKWNLKMQFKIFAYTL